MLTLLESGEMQFALLNYRKLTFIINYFFSDFGFKLFQFQYGTIGSFKIHRYNLIGFVSIPVWYDWEPFIGYLYNLIRHVSIPIWYDWESTLQTREYQLQWFQFQYGAIVSLSLMKMRYDCN